MNLIDIQIELRSIETQISDLHTEIERMKPKPEAKKKADFETITELAKRYPISNSKIAAMPESIQKQYIMGLSYLLLSNEKDIYKRLLYLCRLTQGNSMSLSAEDIYRLGLEFELKDLEELCINLWEYKYSFLVEAFIVANLSEELSFDTLSIIADMAKLMGCEKEEVRVTGQVAKSMLMEDLELIKQIPVPSKNRWMGEFSEYISKEWIEKQRVFCGRICVDKWENRTVMSHMRDVIFARNKAYEKNNFETVNTNHPCVVKKRPPAGSIVKENDIILVYDEEVKNEGIYVELIERQLPIIEKNIIAPCDGIVFFINDYEEGDVPDKEDKYLAVYVVSYYDVYADFCNWYKTKKG